MKKSLLFLLLALMTMGLWAQNTKPLADAERQKVEAELTQAAASMQTLNCRFVQEKTSSMLAEPQVAEGLMQ